VLLFLRKALVAEVQISGPCLRTTENWKFCENSADFLWLMCHLVQLFYCTQEWPVIEVLLRRVFIIQAWKFLMMWTCDALRFEVWDFLSLRFSLSSDLRSSTTTLNCYSETVKQ